MKLRRLIPAAALISVLLLACAPDPVAPAEDASPSSHPTDHSAPSESQPANDPYDY